VAGPAALREALVGEERGAGISRNRNVAYQAERRISPVGPVGLEPQPPDQKRVGREIGDCQILGLAVI
jgi:hypothetical protein